MNIKQGVLKVRVKTGAPKTQVLSWDDDVLRVSVKARPEKGRANLEIIKLFKKEFKRDAKIIKGLKSKDKLVRIL